MVLSKKKFIVGFRFTFWERRRLTLSTEKTWALEKFYGNIIEIIFRIWEPGIRVNSFYNISL